MGPVVVEMREIGLFLEDEFMKGGGRVWWGRAMYMSAVFGLVTPQYASLATGGCFRKGRGERTTGLEARYIFKGWDHFQHPRDPRR